MKKAFRKFFSMFGASKSAPASTRVDAHPAASAEGDPPLVAGDIIIQHDGRKGWRSIKVLAIDEYEGHSPTAHCLTYDHTPGEPTLASISSLTVKIWHAPIAANAFAQGWQRVGNLPVSQDEFVGFVEYLKLTDFPRYVEFTGQDVEELIARANAHYREANKLCDEGMRIEAIREYEQAIDIFPLFFEAIDNRALTLMELGLYDKALSGFEESLQVNPDGVVAFISSGECLLRLGRLDEAERIFAAGLDRFSEQRENFRRFLDTVRELKKKH